ncbi:hypothetical protein VNO80_17927 [Phaseolus coccineus]|uniref:Uncharacterized protein n=1 Tax=Phaseolus coccineus TaxID=3886 RepID=A0AAN9QW06_PHACN
MEHTKYNTRNKYTLHNDVYIQKKVSIPFSWESKPGLSKITHQNSELKFSNIVLQPPPCWSSRTTYNKRQNPEIEIPKFILCVAQPSSTRNRLFQLESQTGDPFIEAYKKCTEIPKDDSFMCNQPGKYNKRSGSRPNIMKYMDIFSCKFSNDIMG